MCDDGRLDDLVLRRHLDEPVEVSHARRYGGTSLVEAVGHLLEDTSSSRSGSGQATRRPPPGSSG